MAQAKLRSSKAAVGIAAKTARKPVRPASPVKRRDAAATRQRILDAALKEFAAKGLDAAASRT